MKNCAIEKAHIGSVLFARTSEGKTVFFPAKRDFTASAISSTEGGSHPFARIGFAEKAFAFASAFMDKNCYFNKTEVIAIFRNVWSYALYLLWS
ncbi:MAG: hypothetical protein IJT76_04160 [Clostridia bacterium]|nr:hypothetical protein [Clostridia bacterium]